MTALHPARWPLRTRVALAFLAATGVALTGVGVFVHSRVSTALEDRLRDTVTAEVEQLQAVPGPERVGSVRALGGEVQAQLLAADGQVQASSSLVAGPLLESPTGVRVSDARQGWRERMVSVYDDDAAAVGRQDPERERYVLLVRPTGDGILVVGTSREDLDEALAELRNQLLIAGPLALAVAGGLGYLVAGSGLRPIERMRSRAATISARSAGERLPLPAADDELQRLALTLNAMLERLDEGLQRERRFAAEAGHELRTPLTLMLTESELALAQPRPVEDLTQALHSINEEVRRLIALADDLLERASTGERRLPIAARRLDLVDLSTRVAARFHAAAGERAIRITAPRPVEVQGDPTHLDRALSNLIDNALRHGAGDVTIEIRPTDHGAALTVTDRGPGFPPNDPFHSSGTGLGLTIVKEIAQAHGGSLDVQRLDHRTHVCLQISSPDT